MTKVSGIVIALACSGFVVIACSKDPPPVTPTANSAQPYQPAPSQTMAPPATTAVPGQMAVPGPTAMACSNDSQCMTHHCNMQYGKCAFPCLSDVDCIQGTTCFVAAGPAAFCAPKPPGAQ